MYKVGVPEFVLFSKSKTVVENAPRYASPRFERERDPEDDKEMTSVRSNVEKKKLTDISICTRMILSPADDETTAQARISLQVP